jgi:hypothetical protein
LLGVEGPRRGEAPARLQDPDGDDPQRDRCDAGVARPKSFPRDDLAWHVWGSNVRHRAFLEMTIPDKPRSSNQKYVATEAGRATLELFREATT